MSRLKNLFVILIAILLIPQISLGIKTKFNVAKETYKKGDSVKGTLRLKNPNYKGMETNVLITYSIQKNKDIIIEKTATIPLGKKRIKILKLELPEDIQPGSYDFKILTKFKNKEYKDGDSFKVKGEGSFPIWLFAIPIILLGIGYMIYKKFT